MNNAEISRILTDISEYLDMQDIPFKPRAYEKAAQVITNLEDAVVSIYEEGGLKALEKIPGVGVSIAEKIEEFIKTGHIKYYDELKRETPVNLEELTRVEGLGPKKIKTLYNKLKIKDVAQLERAAKAGKISKLEGFGSKSEANILKGIEFIKSSGKRFALGEVLPIVKDIESKLKNLKGIKKMVVAGSIRRKKETIGDVDLLVVSEHPKEVMDYFISMPGVAMMLAHGNTKSAVKLKNGLDVDLRVVEGKSYGAALNYFTGSKDHNVALREIAIKKGYKLNEYGLFSAKGGSVSGGKGWRQIAGQNEEEIYRALDLNYIEPEMRENVGEIELSKVGKLPKLIQTRDLKGDLQVQSDWTDGADSIEKLSEAAIGFGLEYIAITDHTKRLAMTNGLDESRLERQMEQIDRLNRKFKSQNINFRILRGTECDILRDGSLDLRDEILAKLDVVGASIHSYFNLPKKDQTKRLEKAMSNPNVDIIFHPTGRLINKRPAYEIDMDRIIEFAFLTKTILEINAFPDRLDLRDEHIKKCVEQNVRMSIDSDAHSVNHLQYLEYGVGQARRGWAKREDIINTYPLEKMLSFLKDRNTN